MAMNQKGAWFGAFMGDDLVATLGMFTGYGVGRFQHVVTHPEYRRQGICGTLVHEIASLALTRDDVDSLVMEADPAHHASRLYKSLGFKRTEILYSLQKVNAAFEGNEEITQKFRVQLSI
jgi:predicted GNAT family acetyltransferase